MKPTPRASVAAVLVLLLLPARASWGVLGDMQMRGGARRTQGVYVGGTARDIYAAGRVSRDFLSAMSLLLTAVIDDPATPPDSKARALELQIGLEAVLDEYATRGIKMRLDRLVTSGTTRGHVVADDGHATDSLVLEDFRDLVERRLTLSGPTPAISPRQPDVAPAELNPFVHLRTKLLKSLGGGTDADESDRVGLAVYSPYEPQQIGAGHAAVAVTYQYWPYNRDQDQHLDDYASGVYDLSGDVGISDAIGLGVSLPLIAQANTPEGTELVRETGLGDPALRLDWWLTERWKKKWIAHAGLQFQVRLPWGSDDVAATDGQPARQGTGLGSAQFGIALRTAIAPKPRFAPRLHARFGYQWDDRDDVTGFGEAVVGAIWNVDPWRAKDATPGDRRWNLGAWLDFAGTYDDPAATSILGNTVESAWEWRAGIGYIRNGGPFGTFTGRRHMLTLEVQHSIKAPGNHSDPFSLQLGYGFTFERSR